MESLSKELDLLGIKVRNYLNITAYHQSNHQSSYESYLIERSLPYFWLNAGTLVTGYVINTIDGPVERPVIGIRQLYARRKLLQEYAVRALLHDERFRRRALWAAITAVNAGRYIPTELTMHIMRYSGLIKCPHVYKDGPLLRK